MTSKVLRSSRLLDQPLRGIYVTNDHDYVPFVVITIQSFPYHRVCIKSNMTGATWEAGTVYPSGAHESTPGF